MDNQDYQSFKVSLEIHICFRGAKIGHTQEQPRKHLCLWLLLPCPGTCAGQASQRWGSAQGQVQGGLHRLALAQLGGFGLLFLLGFVSFEKQEIEPFYDMDFTA